MGLFVMSLSVVASELSDTAKEFVFDVGKAWVPPAEQIGPYTGKETFLLVGWLGSWIILHLALRERNPSVRAWLGFSLALLGLATLLVWPPVWHFLEGL